MDCNPNLLLTRALCIKCHFCQLLKSRNRTDTKHKITTNLVTKTNRETIAACNSKILFTREGKKDFKSKFSQERETDFQNKIFKSELRQICHKSYVGFSPSNLLILLQHPVNEAFKINRVITRTSRTSTFFMLRFFLEIFRKVRDEKFCYLGTKSTQIDNVSLLVLVCHSDFLHRSSVVQGPKRQSIQPTIVARNLAIVFAARPFQSS